MHYKEKSSGSLGSKGRCALVVLVALVGCGDDAGAPPTYYQDVAPLLAERCVHCHQEGGIAPFALDRYERVKPYAQAIRTATVERRMPPWGVTSDGSCGEFADSIALDREEIARIGAWASAGAPEGELATIEQPAAPALEGAARSYMTPSFVPEAQGGALTEHDEYRCFMLDAGVDAQSYITGYDVMPGAPEIAHHVVVLLVDPAAQAEDPELGTNLAQMERLDAESPERPGWECFSGAGEGVGVESSPVVWAPGQGVVAFPEGSGVPLRPDHKVVIQVHYNLMERHGLRDASEIKLRVVDQVESVGLFVLIDPLLDSLFSDTPHMLAPGKASEPYTWKVNMAELGLGDAPGLELHGVMPHMHELGHKYRMTVQQGSAAGTCAADMQRWDFHWQRFYFYQQPIPLAGDTSIEVTCDFDTSARSTPVLPGWGTQNEMCLATLYVTVPVPAPEGR